jgi:exodeoxyribonuclease VII small subunit
LRLKMAALISRLCYKTLIPQRKLGAFSNGVKAMAKEKFEDALEKLEDIVRKMEAGDLPLDDALKSFEEGIKLIRFCSAKLDETQRRVEQLLGNDDSLKVKNFQEEDGNGN